MKLNMTLINDTFSAEIAPCEYECHQLNIRNAEGGLVYNEVADDPMCLMKDVIAFKANPTMRSSRLDGMEVRYEGGVYHPEPGDVLAAA